MTSSSTNNPELNSSLRPSEVLLVNKLHSAFDTTRKKFVSSIKFSLMKKFYRPIYDKNPKALKDIHDQLCSQLLKTISEELDDICEKHGIDFLLSRLEVMKKNQDPSQPSWRPSGNPEEDLRDHLYPIKVKHKEKLQSVLNKLMVCNEELINVATVNHAEILHIQKSVEDLHESFSNITTSLAGTNLQNLERNIHDMNESL